MEQKEFEKLFPIEAGINIMILNLHLFYKEKYLLILSKMAEGTSMSFEYYGYMFPDAYELYDEEYFESGVEFHFHSDVEIVDNETFYKYLKITSEAYINEHQDSKQIVEESLEKIKNNLNLCS